MTDRELLDRYLRDASEEAFAEMVRRHAGTVYALCRRVLGRDQDAEDATQATFLILARKARTVHGKVLAEWLYLTARYAALDMVRQAARRRRHEEEAAMVRKAEAPPHEAASWEDVKPRLDAAVAALPQRFRQAVVLCCLGGRTQAEAASEAGCSREVISRRLTAALEKLRRRLSAGGAVLPAAALGGMLGERAVEAVPASLAVSVSAACAGKVAASAAAAQIAEGTMKAMMIAKVKLAAAVVGAVLAVGTGGGVVAVKLAAAEPVKADPGPPATAPQGGEAAEGWSWTLLDTQPKGAPTNGNESAIVFDTRARKLLYFGGHKGGGGPQRFDTWQIDPQTKTWVQLEPDNRPVEHCCVRDGVYDEANQRTYFLGGGSYDHGWQWKAPKVRGGTLKGGNVPWAYDSAVNTWIPMKPPVAKQGTHWTGATYDRDHQVVITRGGSHPDGTWVYDGYANSWAHLPEKGPTPPESMYVTLIFDPEHHVTLVRENRTGQLWTFDLEANAWTRREAAGGPVITRGEAHPSMVYDPALRMPITFSTMDETLKVFGYDWEKGAWSELPVKGTPPPQVIYQYFVYDPYGRQFFSVNGKCTAADGNSYVLVGKTYRLSHPEPKAGPAVLAAPQGLRVAVEAGGRAALAWEPVPGAARYAVFAGNGANPWSVKYAKVGESDETKFAEAGLEKGVVRYYFVRAADGKGPEGEPSLKVRTQPRVPAEPVVSVLSKEQVEISWEKSPEPDVVGYNVYAGDGQKMAKLNADLVKATTLVDAHAAGSGDDKRRYSVRAVNALGVESGPSPWAATIPSEPKGLLLRVQDGKVLLSWKPNPQKGIKGYNVYRLDSGGAEAQARKIAGPLAETQFAEALPNRETHKYYIAAVDALDQEGYISYGVWLND